MDAPIQMSKVSVLSVASNLLDQGDSFEFPLLQPISKSTVSSAESLTTEPIVREGSPIDFDADPAGDSVSPTVLNQSEAGSLKKGRSIVLLQENGNFAGDDPFAIKSFTPTGWLRWAIDKSGVFGSREEEVSAVKYGVNHRNVFKVVPDNWFFQWGLRYIPPPGHDNIFRTVVIEGLPKNATLDCILPQIRGGAVFSASLLDTSTITGSPTAMITFVHQHGALKFLRRVEQDGFFVGINLAKVRPIPTPTYLMSSEMETQIHRFGRTRCLAVSSRQQKGMKKEVHRVLSRSRVREYVECFGEHDTDGQVTVRFYSVQMAWAAFMILTSDFKFKGAFMKPAPDPCARL